MAVLVEICDSGVESEDKGLVIKFSTLIHLISYLPISASTSFKNQIVQQPWQKK